MDMYSKRNILLNPGAEKGTMESWTSAGVSVVLGGPGERSAYCFRLAPTANMSQTVMATKQIPSLKVGGWFLPEYPTTEPEKKVFIRVTNTYPDTEDIHLIPCVESGGELAGGDLIDDDVV